MSKRPTYRIEPTRNPRGPDEAFKVVLVRTGAAVFYGPRKDCQEWMEHAGDDENN